MKTSDQIELLFKALVAAQAEAQHANFDSLNPHFRSKYASLAEVIDTLRPVMAKHGLAVLQLPGWREDRGHVLCNRVLHESGQWLEEEIVLTPVKTDPQGLGSAITYAKRYSLPGFFMIASEEDDDANAASHGPQVTPKQASESTIKSVFDHIAELNSEGEVRAYYPIAKTTLNAISNSPLKARLDQVCKERLEAIKVVTA